MDGAVLKGYPLNKERTTIRRKPHNDVVIDDLAVAAISAIVTILNDSFLETWTAGTNGSQSTARRRKNTSSRTTT